jgi:hypothetical protein
MKGGIERFSRFKDAKGDLDEFAPHGPDNQLGWLIVRGEAFAEAVAPVGFVEGDQGRHVEGAAQKGVADFGETRFAPDTAAGFAMLRIEPRAVDTVFTRQVEPA